MTNTLPKSASLNALTHGITSRQPVIRGLERRKDWSNHQRAIISSLAPQTHIELALAERVASLLWRLRRLSRYESAALAVSQHTLQTDLRELHTANPSSSPTPDALRDDLALDRAILDLLERLRDLPGDHPIPYPVGSHALCLCVASSCAPPGSDPSLWILPPDWEPSARPANPTREPWTANKLQGQIHFMVNQEGRKVSLSRLIKLGAGFARARVASAESRIKDAEHYLALTRELRLLPDDATLEKVLRYESHLSRLLRASLRELRALQAKRTGLPASLAGPQVTGLPGSAGVPPASGTGLPQN